MPLNKATGNMYDFVTHTWNTVKGECPHSCSYCYMKRWGKQPELHFDEKELNTNLGSDNIIFVGSSCDMFAENIPERWILETLEKCRGCGYRNQYWFQTKNPKRFIDLIGRHPSCFPFESIFCVTLESDYVPDEIRGRAPDILSRLQFIKEMRRWIDANPIYWHHLAITIEPIIDFDLNVFSSMIASINPDRVSIGADSGKNNLPEPSSEKVQILIDEISQYGIPVVKKDNLKRILK